jgi:hypothetical protein
MLVSMPVFAQDSRFDGLANLPFRENRPTPETAKTLRDELLFQSGGISLDGIPQGRKSSRIYCSIRYANFATDPQIAKCLCAGNKRDKSVGFSQLFATDS